MKIGEFSALSQMLAKYTSNEQWKHYLELRAVEQRENTEFTETKLHKYLLEFT